jgi:hypothetical protein
LLSQIPTPAPGATETWLWSCAALLGIALVFKNLFHRSPSIEAEFATKTELRAVETKIDGHIGRIEIKLDERLDALDIKRSRQVAALHLEIHETERALTAQIKVVAENTAFIRGKLEGN